MSEKKKKRNADIVQLVNFIINELEVVHTLLAGDVGLGPRPPHFQCIGQFIHRKRLTPSLLGSEEITVSQTDMAPALMEVTVYSRR